MRLRRRDERLRATASPRGIRVARAPPSARSRHPSHASTASEQPRAVAPRSPPEQLDAGDSSPHEVFGLHDHRRVHVPQIDDARDADLAQSATGSSVTGSTGTTRRVARLEQNIRRSRTSAAPGNVAS